MKIAVSIQTKHNHSRTTKLNLSESNLVVFLNICFVSFVFLYIPNLLHFRAEQATITEARYTVVQWHTTLQNRGKSEKRERKLTRFHVIQGWERLERYSLLWPNQFELFDRKAEVVRGSGRGGGCNPNLGIHYSSKFLTILVAVKWTGELVKSAIACSSMLFYSLKFARERKGSAWKARL